MSRASDILEALNPAMFDNVPKKELKLAKKVYKFIVKYDKEHGYSSSTEAAEDAADEFNLHKALDDEVHWIWEIALWAMGDMDD